MRKVWNISGIKKRISIKKACIVLCGLVFFAGIAGYSHMSRADENILIRPYPLHKKRRLTLKRKSMPFRMTWLTLPMIQMTL